VPDAVAAPSLWALMRDRWLPPEPAREDADAEPEPVRLPPPFPSRPSYTPAPLAWAA